MKPTPVRPGPPITAVEVQSLEKQLGFDLPPEYRGFLLQFNGGKPEANIHRSDGDVGVSFWLGFFGDDPVRSGYDVRKNLAMASRFTKLQGLLPVAESEGGNLLLINSAGAVLFWDHETHQLRVINNSFPEFISQLDAPPSEEISQQDLSESWIDPAFLEELKRQE